uniref:Uncharacterized protein n=1 Tax=Panagrolaimus davidi TaxID=227884 RepID=A0A914PDZ4_9BILA
MSYPLHPENNDLKKYYLHGKYKLDKSMSTTTSFATKYLPVEGMKDVEWQIRITTLHVEVFSPFWGIYLDVKSTVPIKYEGTFGIASERFPGSLFCNLYE